MAQATTSIPPQLKDRLWQGLPEGLLVLDKDGVVTSANEQAASFLGHKTEALIGSHYRIFWPENLPPVDEIATDGDAARNHEALLRQPDGRFLPAAVSVSNVSPGTKGNILVAITSMDDVQRLNEALMHVQRLAGVGTLTASVAHELNTPISIITSTCNNLLYEVDENELSAEQLVRYVRIIEQTAWRCARIVEVLRNYTLDDAPQMAVTDLNMVVEDGLALVRHQFSGDFGIEIETELSSTLGSIVCDHNRMTQVLINLLTNARDAMSPDGGDILVKTWTVRPQDDVYPNGETAVAEYAFSVRDTGQGIAPGVMAKMFDPFFTTKPSGKGTGLGLFIARRIVAQHNGRIWAENNPDGGATFTVVLPRKQ